MTDKPFTPRAIDTAAKTPIDDAAFAALMARLGPFEDAPHVAVGVSGGADSLSLAVLADAWARARGGRITALIVDHGLRAESAHEARDVKARLQARNIAAEVLPWRGDKPASGVQAAARAARYALMGDWLRRHGVLHLLLGHHRDDQAETFLLRLDAKSGIDGLAGMAPVSERRGFRLLRPFLHVPKVQLIATVTKHKLPWVEDPSNRNRVFARVRVRDGLNDRDAGADAPPVGRMVDLVRRIGQLRMGLEVETWAQLAEAVSLHPAGFAVVSLEALRAMPDRLALRVLARSVQCIGGRAYAPRTEKAGRLLERLLSGGPIQGATLGGCRILMWPHERSGAGFYTRTDGILVCRENRGLPDALAVRPGWDTLWDNRFHLAFDSEPAGRGASWVAPLGREGWRQVIGFDPSQKGTALPVAVRPGLPALWDDAGVAAQPHLGFRRINHNPALGMPLVRLEKASFSPTQSLGGQGFCLA